MRERKQRTNTMPGSRIQTHEKLASEWGGEGEMREKMERNNTKLISTRYSHARDRANKGEKRK